MKYDVVVIGASAGGLTAAISAKRFYPDKSVLVIKKEQTGMIPCGIPYIFGTFKSVDDDILPAEKFLEPLGVETLVDEVVEIDPKAKIVRTKSGKEIAWEKLVIATGSKPVFPELPGAELEDVYTVPKDYHYLKALRERLESAEKVVIVGGGFIALEVGDEIRKLGKDVTLLVRSRLLRSSFDPEFSEMVEGRLKEAGINIVYGQVERLLGSEKVEKVKLVDGNELDADLVIFSIGYRPNVDLAIKAGLKVTRYGIWTDEYMRTSHPDIFAVGDCVEHRDFFTGKPYGLMLASTATFEARIAGANLFRLQIVRENRRTIGVYSTHVAGLTLAAAGLTEEAARREGFEVIVGYGKGPDRHPAKFPDTSMVTAKLIFSRDRGAILGAQIAGGKSVGEMINILALAIQKRLTASELYTLQIATHPLLTASPVGYQIVKAAEDALAKLRT
ncbi:pyridine nucleotide-disulfide oxidoreductase [Thermococcus sp. GR7]|uniref:NAD(P)/FAD-dependent oxidoreductase n=1 Tax=unclassified Thermococcus TaxID=2627626 RepID=UPI001431A870|nr:MULTISPECIES: FAD-dependent oxidoreductase [unclassified Thermococcus]NJE47051.1 pyridine nucleotide-disulfide oxidoreductase [Thermococcus sp. GR7]NJE78124.1 pyridine nucleotide-disulfide oxidoreductase [Thermococcus sp. GR4]NJF22759.1 pyridine nucleotide-disulfide oxidoreductase [Thermococcus sp. GR5]